MKKIIALILVMLLAVTCMAGCGKKTASGEKVELLIGVPGGDGLTPLALIEEFQKNNPDIIVKTDEAPWGDFRSKLDMQLAGGTAPDVFITDSGHATSISYKGVVKDLSENIKKDLDTDDYISSLFALEDAEGHVYGIPHAINSTALFYNEELFDKAGLAYPDETWTWQDAIDAAKKLTGKTNQYGVADVYGLGIGSSITTGWLPVIMATGGTPVNKDRTKSNFDDPKTIEGVKKFEEIVKSGITPPLAWYTTQGSTAAAFYQGKLAMTIMQSNSAKSIISNKPDLRWNVSEIPLGWDGDRNTVYVPNVWMINSKSSEAEQEAAWKWLKFYLSEEAQLLIAEGGCKGGYPIHKKALEYCDSMEGAPANKSVFYKTLDETGTTLFENATWADWKAQADAVFKDLYNGMLTAEDAAKEIHKRVSKALKD